ncbi:ABC transporter ATP-binding protein [Paenibacillus terreus]|uniref:ABC transporter ATP-binding protein n=1 Tax=Paenibacillus terreus TaxID=1387834 RepID=A0ABV5B385_9BACL
MIPLVELQNIKHVYVTEKEAALAVDNVNFTVAPGEFISLVGPSGCGKTTILSMIAGLLQPAAGRVLLQGKPVAGPDHRVGYMLQQDYLFPWRTILENTMLGFELTRTVKEDPKARVLRLLEDMGLKGTENLYPSQLSGGMRQRVALVRTLATDPDLLLLDEPFSALDYQTKLQLEDLIAETLRTHGKTAVLVTHDLAEAIAVSDRILVLDRNPGRIRSSFTVPEPIRKAQPFYAREQEGFNELFRDIWAELEASGAKE